MSTPDERSVEDLFAAFVDDLSVWQVFLLGLWIFSHLLHKLAGTSKEFLKRCFLDTSRESQPSGRVETFGCESGAGPSSALCSSDTSDGASRSRGVLIPSLPDDIVRDRVWPALVSSPSVSLLLNLRHLNTSWSRFVGGTLEWKALTFLWLDSPGYYSYILRHKIIGQTPNERLGFELANFRFLVCESMDEIESRVRCSRRQTGFLPFYVSGEDCPPCVGDCPEYYGL